MNDVIMGACHLMDWPRCEAFAVSARRACPDARVIVVGALHKEVAGTLLALGCEISENDYLLDYTMLTGHPSNIRWWLFADVLRRIRADRVFLTDTRDVVLQGDVFRHAPERGILTPTEGRPIRETVVPFWEQFMKERLPGVSMETVLGWEMACPGNLLGSSEDILWYLKEQIRESTRWPRVIHSMGLNMPIHNRLVHCVAPDRFIRSGPDDGVFAILSAMPDDVQYDTVAGYTVLHAYDLRSGVRGRVCENLGLKNDPARWSLGPFCMGMSDVHGGWLQVGSEQRKREGAES